MGGPPRIAETNGFHQPIDHSERDIMDLSLSPKAELLRQKLLTFMAEHVYPSELELFRSAGTLGDQWKPLPLLEDLKKKARAAGLWNLFLPGTDHGAGLTNLEYAPLAEVMGRSHWAPEIFNCDAPNTGNMEVLVQYGTEAQKQNWLVPLLNGEIRSAFAMTEPNVASSDATNIETEIRREGDEYVINGHKWFISGAGDPRCRILITMGKTDAKNPDRHRQQSMILVPLPHPGVIVKRPMLAFGFDDAPHGHMEIIFDNARVPASNILLGEGRGFEIAQGRLGPGRIHHCMRMVGLGERALERTCRRLKERVTFGKPIAEQTVWMERIANARCKLDQARLLTLRAAHMMDTVGNKAAKQEIALIKVVAPAVATEILDMAIQAFGAGGFSDQLLMFAYFYARSMRVADGPDEVHRNQIAKLELRKYDNPDAHRTGGSTEIMVADGKSPPGRPLQAA
jgi:acyl-CoA dehydrogenase